MDLRQTIAKKVKNEMAMRELTTYDLATASGTSQPFVSKLTRGVHSPTIELLDRVRRSLELSWEELLEE